MQAYVGRIKGGELRASGEECASACSTSMSKPPAAPTVANGSVPLCVLAASTNQPVNQHALSLMPMQAELLQWLEGQVSNVSAGAPARIALNPRLSGMKCTAWHGIACNMHFIWALQSQHVLTPPPFLLRTRVQQDCPLPGFWPHTTAGFFMLRMVLIHSLEQSMDMLGQHDLLLA